VTSKHVFHKKEKHYLLVEKFRMYLPNNEDIVDLPVHFTFSLVLSFYRDCQNMSMHINKAVLRCLVCWEHSTVNIETTAMKMHRGQSRYQKGFFVSLFFCFKEGIYHQRLWIVSCKVATYWNISWLSLEKQCVPNADVFCVTV